MGSRKLGTLHHYCTSFCEHCQLYQFVVRQQANITVLPVKNNLNTVHVNDVRASVSSVQELLRVLHAAKEALK